MLSDIYITVHILGLFYRKNKFEDKTKINYVINMFSSNFRNVASSLRSLDLSDNQLGKLPLQALSRLKALDWINLHK